MFPFALCTSDTSTPIPVCTNCSNCIERAEIRDIRSNRRGHLTKLILHLNRLDRSMGNF